MDTAQQEMYQLFDELYLIEEPELSTAKEREKKEKENSLIFKGGNQKKIAFIINEKQGLSEMDKEMVGNLIQAIKISIEDIALLNLAENEVLPFAEIISELQCEKIIFLGCESYVAAEGMNKALYSLLYSGNTAYVNAHAISAYHSDKELKVKLWNVLKVMFNV